MAKESIFTGMNNLDVITTTSNEYATFFGFTEEEVFTALDDAGLGEHKQKVKRWYDGFTYGACTDIYNPWSIVSFIKKKGKYDTYWSNTSGNGRQCECSLEPSACDRIPEGVEFENVGYR